MSLSFRSRLVNVIGAFIGIAENLVIIFTFSSVFPGWEMDWLAWNTKRMYRKNQST